MNKFIHIATATSIAFSGISVAAVSDASAATKYTVKSGKLVNSKTGKAATGKVLHKGTLYVNGKVKSGIEKYKNVFYKKGKKVTSKMKFVYKDRLYVGQKLAKGIQTFVVDGSKSAYKNGKPYTGVYDAIPYKNGESPFELESNKMNHQGFIYSQTGTDAVYIFDFTGMDSKSILSVTAKTKATVTNGAQVKSIQLKQKKLYVNLTNVQANKKYKLTISNVPIKTIGTWKNSVSFTGLTNSLKKRDGYTAMNKAYWKYKDYTQAQARKVSVDSIASAIMPAIEYSMNIDTLSKKMTIEDASYALLVGEMNRIFDEQIIFLVY